MRHSPLLVLAAFALLTPVSASNASVRTRTGGAQPQTIKLPADLADFTRPGAITAGWDGTVWIAAGDTRPYLVHAGPTGTIAQFSPAGEVHGLTVTKDGSLWYSLDRSTTLRRVSPSGVVAKIVTGLALARYDWIGAVARGTGGTVWFDAGEGRLVHLSPTGAIRGTVTPIGKDGSMLGTDSGGAVWVLSRSTVEKVADDGSAIWKIQVPDTFNAIDRGYTFGPDGSFWIGTDTGLIRIAPDGKLSTLALAPMPEHRIGALAFDPAGTLWFTSEGPDVSPDKGGTVGSVASDGTVTSYPQEIGPDTLSFDSTGRLWYGVSATVIETRTPPPSECAVPSLYGSTLAAAQAAIQKTTCALGPTQGATTGTIWGQTPAPGTTLKAGSAVTVLVGQGTPGITGVWAGTVTDSICHEDGVETPEGDSGTDQLAIRAGAGGKLTATLSGDVDGGTFAATAHKGSTYTFGKLTVRLSWPSVSIDIAYPSDDPNCTVLDSTGDLFRAASP